MHTEVKLFLISLACLTSSAQVMEKIYTLGVTNDVTLERGSQNFNYLSYLIVGTHPDYPLKRSLMKFQDIPSDCSLPLQATLNIFFVYAHKASFKTIQRCLHSPGTLQPTLCSNHGWNLKQRAQNEVIGPTGTSHG